ncbi:MAG: FAD-dependent oxidoreductase [Candidatus Aenigmarchaeota archaeon]|nr:FAD-dependent oxidoreductase [Candidatus Aenigmarchaeota archaeon]
MYDVIVVGGGAAGLSAAIFTSRRKLKTLVISIDIGGQTNLTNKISNYPGFTDLSGPKLMDIFRNQAKSTGTEFIFGKFKNIEKEGEGKDQRFIINLTNGESYKGRAVILAYGKVPRTLGIPGEDKFVGRGISTNAVQDGHIYKQKKVAVIGGGNSAVEAAELLSETSSKVYLVHRRQQFRAEEITIERVRALSNVEFVLDSVPTQIKGNSVVQALTVEDVNSKSQRELKIDGVFIEIGFVTDTSFVNGLVKVNAANEIITNEYCETSTPGLFAAGDVTTIPYKQTIVSAGHGATAGLSAYTYLQKLDGKPVVKIDWT